jgi:hypothetical protein
MEILIVLTVLRVWACKSRARHMAVRGNLFLSASEPKGCVVTPTLINSRSKADKPILLFTSFS